MKSLKLKQLFYNDNKNSHLIDMNHTYDPRSLASYIQLKKFYLNISNEGNLPLKVRTYLNFRNNILKRIKKENKGNLVCFYCGETYLDPNVNNPNKKRLKATIDHYKPQAKGGKKYDLNNIKVSCLKCNQIKGDLTPNQFKNNIKNNDRFNGEF